MLLHFMEPVTLKFVPLLLVLFHFSEAGPVTKGSKPFTQLDAETYLTKFGYLQTLPEPRSSTDLKEYNAKKAEQKTKAIQLFQKFAGLPETGKIDDKTSEKMLAPRCGISDLDSLKRDATNKWDKNVLQWTVKQFSAKGYVTEGDIRQAMQQAFDIWSKVIPLDFKEIHPDSTDADIQVKFASGQHDDPYPFDGPSRVLAHAFYPKDGRLHFDDDEQWAFNDRKKLTDEGYTDLLSVATHELGHSLGLAHSKDQGAVMIPYYVTPKESGVALGDDDIQRIQQLYGPRRGTRVLATPVPTSKPTPKIIRPQPQPQPTPKMPSDGDSPSKTCPSTIDAATTAMNGYSYFFYGNSVWIENDSGRGSAPEFVDQLFPQGPSSGVTAAVTNQNSQLTLLFQGRQVYAFEWNSQGQKFVLQNGFPKQITDDVPFVPKSAFRWTDGNVVVANGDDFVTFDEYWNKVTFKNKISNYFSSSLASPSAEVFNYQSDIIVLNGNKYSIFDANSKQTKGETSPLSQLLKC